MARGKRKQKPVKLAAPSAGMVAGRRAEAVDVDDPYQEMGKPKASVRVYRYIAATPLLAIYKRGRLQTGSENDAVAANRYAAGEVLRSIYERAEIGGSRAIDYSRVKVDISFAHPEIAPATMDALTRLSGVRKELGDLYPILDAVVCRETRFEAYLRQKVHRDPSRDERLEFYRELRDALDSLVDYFARPARRRVASDGVHVAA